MSLFCDEITVNSEYIVHAFTMHALIVHCTHGVCIPNAYTHSACINSI